MTAIVTETITKAVPVESTKGKKQQEQNEGRVVQRPVWKNIILIGYLHLGGINGCFLVFRYKIITLVFGVLLSFCAALGVTAGAHRLWTHKSYKAKTGLRIVLMLWQTLAAQNPITVWARDHRVHHKFTDTDADPHNAARGFFFSHVGWLLMTKHPDVTQKGKSIDMSDLEADPVVMFQKKYFWPLTVFVGFVFPWAVVHYGFGEPFWIAYYWSMARYMIVLNITWVLNSGAHLWGMKPYDKNIRPTDSLLLGMLCFGEGWHNYHHVFPWDYKTSELSTYGYNFTIPFIDFCAKMGWAYDLKTVSDEMIRKRMARTGDGSNKYSKIKDLSSNEEEQNNNNNNDKTLGEQKDEEELHIWGWDDDDMSQEERKLVTVYNKED